MRPIRYSEPSSSVFLRGLGRPVGHSEQTPFGSHSAHVFDRSVSPAQRVQRTFAHTLRYCWVGYKNRVARRHSSNRPVLSKCSKHTDTNACVCNRCTTIRNSPGLVLQATPGCCCCRVCFCPVQTTGQQCTGRQSAAVRVGKRVSNVKIFQTACYVN